MIGFDVLQPRPMAHHQNRIGSDVINVVITHFRQVLHPTGPLPSLGPQLFKFQIKELLAGIAVVGNVLVTQERVGFRDQFLGHIAAVCQNEIAGAGPRAPRLARPERFRIFNVHHSSPLSRTRLCQNPTA